MPSRSELIVSGKTDSSVASRNRAEMFGAGILSNAPPKSREIRHSTARAGSFSGEKGVSKFYRKARFSNLLRICGCQTHKLRPQVINDKEIAVRPVVIAKPDVCADGLRIRGIHLQCAAQAQEARKRIVALQTRKVHRKVPLRQTKAVPGLHQRSGEFCCWPIGGPDAKLIERPAIVPAEAFKKIVGKPPVQSGSVR